MLGENVEWYTRHILWIFAGVLWLCAIAAAVDMRLGNPTAINGVVGASIAATFCSVAAAILRKLLEEADRG